MDYFIFNCVTMIFKHYWNLDNHWQTFTIYVYNKPNLSFQYILCDWYKYSFCAIYPFKTIWIIISIKWNNQMASVRCMLTNFLNTDSFDVFRLTNTVKTCRISCAQYTDIRLHFASCTMMIHSYKLCSWS